ncbi:MAG: carboxypeptidase-like regulatory domain-containing protein [Planctomycetota bacterium]
MNSKRKWLFLMASIALVGIGMFALRFESGMTDSGLASEKAVGSKPLASNEEFLHGGDVQSLRDIETAEPGRKSVVDPAPRALHSDAAPECVLIGRVLDETRKPIPAAVVGVGKWGEWPEEPGAGALEGTPGWTMLQGATDAEGRFRLEIQVLPKGNMLFVGTAGPMRSKASITFGSGGRSQPALSPGERELGDVLLSAAGVVAGNVVDSQGRPVAEAEVRLGQSQVTTLGIRGQTAEDGTFVLHHAPLGNYGVVATKVGYLSAFEGGLEVKAEQWTEGVLLTLADAPTIEGRVLDPSGNAIAGARIQGRPAGSGSGAQAESDESGSFVLFLPNDQPYLVEVSAKGFESWGGSWRTDAPIEQGTRDLHIVLEPIPEAAFAVLDGETGKPVQEFFFTVRKGAGGGYGRLVQSTYPTQSYPGGIAKAYAQEKRDQVAVWAPGYRGWQEDVQWDAPNSLQQTIRLAKGVRVIGRVLRDGSPVPDLPVIAVRLVEDFGPNPMAGGFDATQPRTVLGYREDSSSKSQTVTGQDGRFEFDGLEPQPLRIKVLVKGSAPFQSEPIHMLGGSTKNLGDIHLREPAQLEGSVLLPPGVSPSGLIVIFADGKGPSHAKVDAEGRFRMEDLPPGRHSVALESPTGVIADGAKAGVTLRAGEVSEVQIDARDCLMCQVTLNLRISGDPAIGFDVQIDADAGGGRPIHLSKTDGEGRTQGRVPAKGSWQVILHNHTGSYRIPQRIDLEARTTLEQTLDLPLGRVEFQLPAGVSLPAEGYIEVNWNQGSGHASGKQVAGRIHGGVMELGSPNGLEITGSSLFVDRVLPGPAEGTLEIGILRPRAEGEEMVVGGRYTLDKAGNSFQKIPAHIRFSWFAVVEAGKTVSAQLQ